MSICYNCKNNTPVTELRTGLEYPSCFFCHIWFKQASNPEHCRNYEIKRND